MSSQIFQIPEVKKSEMNRRTKTKWKRFPFGQKRHFGKDPFPEEKYPLRENNISKVPYLMIIRNVFGGEHSGPIYGSSHIWAPYMKTRKPLSCSCQI